VSASLCTGSLLLCAHMVMRTEPCWNGKLLCMLTRWRHGIMHKRHTTCGAALQGDWEVCMDGDVAATAD
jgi:hypothetical protein